MINSIIIVTLLSFSLLMSIIGIISILIARIVASCYYKKIVKKKRHLRLVK